MSLSELSPGMQGPFRSRASITLASASPRRQALLSKLGLHFHVQPSNIPEPLPDPEESAQEYVVRLARHKVQDVAARNTKGILLAADTVVAVGHELLGKPKSADQALTMLTRLNACTHEVYT